MRHSQEQTQQLKVLLKEGLKREVTLEEVADALAHMEQWGHFIFDQWIQDKKSKINVKS